MGLQSNLTDTPAKGPEYNKINEYIDNNYVEKRIKNQYDDEGNELREVPSEELTLRNLGSRVTAELREQMERQKMLNVPLSEWTGQFEGAQDADLIPSLSPEIGVDRSELKNATWSAIDTVLNTITLGFWAKRVFRKDLQYICGDVSLRIGEAPVINPPWQFNELDDIRSDSTYPHMGRVYLHNIYSNFPILIFQPGREKSNANFLTFFGKGVGVDSQVLNSYIRSGGEPGIINGFLMFLVSAKNFIVGGIEAVLGALTGSSFFNATKYITFKPAFKLYRKIANNLLREYAANLGLLSLSGEPSGPVPAFDSNGGTSNFPNFDKDGFEEIFNAEKEEHSTYNEVPEELTKDDDKQALYGESSNPVAGDTAGESNSSAFGEKIQTTYEYLGNDSDALEDKSGEQFNSTYRGTIKKLDVIDFLPRPGYLKGTPSYWYDPKTWINAEYLPYLCQNTISVSETFSNSAEDHPLISQINSMAQQRGQEQSMGGQAGKLLQSLQQVSEDTMNGGNLLESFKSAISGVALSVATGAGKDLIAHTSELGMIMNGGGRLTVPQIWSGSSFSRNYSVDFEFWSPVGDLVSIFENVYIPALLLMVLAAPIQTGYNSYASPFVMKVYSKGLFSIDFGMVESLTITRGEEKNDRTMANFPKTIKVSMSIKDLQPTLMMSVGGGAFWRYSRANSSMNEYIATMCNLTISDRESIARQFRMFWSETIAGLRDKFTLSNIGYNFSQSIIMKPVMWWNKANANIDQLGGKEVRF